MGATTFSRLCYIKRDFFIWDTLSYDDRMMDMDGERSQWDKPDN